MNRNFKYKIESWMAGLNERLEEKGVKLVYLSRSTKYDYNKMIALINIDDTRKTWYDLDDIGIRFKNHKEAYRYMETEEFEQYIK